MVSEKRSLRGLGFWFEGGFGVKVRYKNPHDSANHYVGGQGQGT